jgi:hypothetical protein
MYGLIGTAKLNGIAAGAWLRHVLAHIADHPVNRVDEFLPWYCAGQLAPTKKHADSQRCDAIIAQLDGRLKTALSRRLLNIFDGRLINQS